MLSAREAKLKRLYEQSRWFMKAIESPSDDGDPCIRYVGKIMPEVWERLESLGYEVTTSFDKIGGMEIEVNFVSCANAEVSDEEVEEHFYDHEDEVNEEKFKEKKAKEEFIEFIENLRTPEDENGSNFPFSH